MFSSIVALLSNIVPAQAPALVPSAALAGASTLDRSVSMLTETVQVEGQDRRDFFVGRWDCSGTKTVDGQVLPYEGTMHNWWKLDHTWLFIEFKESKQAPGEPFLEDQYWGYSQETSTQTRPMMTSVNGFALLVSEGWQGDVSEWAGTYTVAGTVLEITETVTILGPNKVRMLGKMFSNGVFVGGYDVVCTRKGNAHHNRTPTA